jgi:transposase
MAESKKGEQTFVRETWIRAFVEQAEKSGNVSRACSEAGVGRRTFYKWRERYCGGKNLPRRRHPQAKEERIVDKALRLALEYPEWGCDRIAYYLKLKGDSVSSPTVQKILARNGLRTVADRLTRNARLRSG